MNERSEWSPSALAGASVIPGNPHHVRTIWKLAAFTGLALFAHVVAIVPAAVIAKLTRLVGASQLYPLLTAGGVLAASWLTLRLLDKQPIGAIGIGPGRRWLLHGLLGLVLGTALFALVWLTFRLAGFATSTMHAGAAEQWRILLIGGLLCFGVAAYEEILFRGYAFQVLARWNVPAATIICGLAFVAIHLPNRGGSSPLAILNVFLVHLFYVAVFLRTRSLWWPIGLHAAWNFVEAFVFGMPLSGRQPKYSVLVTQIQTNLWTGNDFGPEAGVITTIVLAAATIVAWRWLRQQLPTPDLLSAPEPQSRSVGPTQGAADPSRFAVRVGPVPASRRIQAIDVLRGAAILGILPMNMQLIAMIDSAYLNPYAGSWTDNQNVSVWVALQVLIGHKDLSVFSMLFGAGVLLMSARRGESGQSTTALHYSRMAVLFAFGMVHAYLVWSGDILVTYAICGCLAYLLRNLRPGPLLAIGSAAYAVPMVLLIVAQLMLPFLGEGAVATVHDIFRPAPEMIAEHNAIYGGSWWTQMSARAGAALGLQTGLFLLGLLWVCGGMMLVGMAFHKWGVFSARLPDRTYGQMAATCGAVGLSLILWGLWRNFAADWNPESALLGGRVPSETAAPIMAAAWIGVVMLICKKGVFRRLTEPVSAVGRMALTNYLAHSLICTLIFYGHGMGLVGRIDRIGQLLMTIALWVATLVWSPLWLKRFHFGPMEWLWRSLSHGHRQPMRIGAASIAAALAQ